MTPRAKFKLGCIVLPAMGVVYLVVPFVWGYAGPERTMPEACEILPLWPLAFTLGYEETHEGKPRIKWRGPYQKPDEQPQAPGTTP